MRIYLCRHGETPWTLADKHTGETDVPLTEKGKQQSKRLGQKLPHQKWGLVLTSPLQRANETCQLAGLEGTEDPDAKEWNYGDYEGLTQAQISQKNPTWNLFTNGAPNGESPAQVGGRADRLLKRIRFQSGDVILFSHGHFLRVFAARWLGLKPEQGQCFLLSVASLSLLGLEHGKPVIQLWNAHD